jgi:cytochrome c
VRFTIATAAFIASIALAGQAQAGPAEDLMTQAKCSKCHGAKTTKKGPSFADVAAKYKGKPDPTAEMVNLLKTGGKDDHEILKASDDQIKAVIAVVLAAK